MSSDVSFADVVQQSIVFDESIPAERVVLQLLDTPWVQRLRDISQTANTKLVYMFSEHSRFGHSLGVASLANLLTARLEKIYPEQISPYRAAVNAAALMHDIGHMAPGSHTAYRTWFPGQPDVHEQIAAKIVTEDCTIAARLSNIDPALPEMVAQIILETDETPSWTKEIISGGGWNVDRGNWCIVDSVMAGVSYGKYNIPALVDSIELTEDGHLAMRENRLDAMMHFALSRHAMYRQIYQHRVLLAADTLNTAIVKRVRHLVETEQAEKLFLDLPMKEVILAKTPDALSLRTVYSMRESWWRYHLSRWCEARDHILRDLSERLLDRRLLKTVRIKPTENLEDFLEEAQKHVTACGYDPEYYLHEVSTSHMHGGEKDHSMKVRMDDGSLRSMFEAEPLFEALTSTPESPSRSWLVLPEDAKERLGRNR
jgi:HD superfamily phosphohydrolase